VALSAIADEIEKSYGTDYVQTRRFKSKKALAQEAHEAIRPTYIDRRQVTSDRDQQKLYDLIWKRTIASQMAEAILEKTVVNIGISTINDAELRAEGEVLKFDGFLKVYLAAKEDDDDEEAKGILPPLKVGQNLGLSIMNATERFTRAPARYTEASLVKKLEELGIGRPSTYAPTITKIMEANRGYVSKESSEGIDREYSLLTLNKGEVSKKVETEKTGVFKNRLVSSDLGMLVVDFLSEHFGDIMNYSFTADIEKQFDTIASGGEEWAKMLGDFYSPFHANVEETLENAERATGERILGTDPESGRTLLVRMSRFGPIVQIGKTEELAEDEKPKYASLRPGQSLETIDMETALELFKLPKTIGQYEGEDVIIGIGRFGPYVKIKESFISLEKGEDPMSVEIDRAIQLIEEKRKADAPIGTFKGLPITKGKGRFGPFVKYDGMFVNIPRKFDPETITMDEIFTLIEAKIEKEANRYIHRWDDEKITVENGRWGPYIKFKKKNVKIPKVNDKRVTSEEAKEFTLEDVKKMIEVEIPDAFKTKKKAAAKAKPKAKAKAKK